MIQAITMDDLKEAQAEISRVLKLIQDGLHCDFDDKSVPLRIDDDSDASVGLEGSPYLSLSGNYEIVPSSFLRGIERTMGEDAYSKCLDVWQQVNDPNYGTEKDAMLPKSSTSPTSNRS